MTNIATNIDTLPDLSSDYALTPDQKDDYARDGHILLRGVCSPEEVSAYRQAINGAVERLNTETRPLEQRDTYGKAFLQISNLWPQDEAVRRFSLARRFAKIATELMGTSGVRMYHDQALFKEPGGGQTPWHQDQSYWPLETPDTITMWMPLVPIPLEVGSMTFVSGTHKGGGELRPLNTDNPISDASQAEFDALVRDQNLPTRTYGAMAAGDATFHAGWTLHSAPGNPTANTREVMTIIYYPDGVRVMEPKHKFQAKDLQVWLPGLQPGDPANSELNPLLFSR